MRRALVVVFLVACGARSELRGTVVEGDASAHDASSEDVAPSTCAAGLVQLATAGAQPDQIAIAQGWVYWHDETGVHRVKASGGAAEIVATTAPPYQWPNLAAFALAGDAIFYGDGDAITRRSLTTSDPPTILDKYTKPAFGVSASHVYVWSRNSIQSLVIQFGLDGSLGQNNGGQFTSPSKMTFVAPETGYVACDPGVVSVDYTSPYYVPKYLSGLAATDIVVSGGDVFFTSNDATNGARVMHLVLSSPNATPILGTDGAFAIAQDSSDLFFTDAKNLRVRRIDAKSGPVDDIANVGPDFAPMDLVVDDTCVYFTSAPKGGSAGAIMGAPKH